tara:strand:+ start:1321 stop:2094 length:774 start_codon:yes stop_codon:yes gene_type:complete
MRILKKEQRYAMFTIYSFCKKADSIADNKDLNKNKIKKINQLKKEINNIFKNNLNSNFGKTLKFYIDKYKINKKYFFDIISGVEMDIQNKMICPKKNIFNLYCYRVAGAVGLISLKIFKEYNVKSKSFGLHLAKALQITNILRDIKEDMSYGRMYIPKDILNNVGIKDKKINLIVKNKKFPKACEKLSELAELNFKLAEKELKFCSKKRLKSAILMMSTYKLLLKKLKKKGWNDLKDRVSLTKFEKIMIFFKGIISV